MKIQPLPKHTQAIVPYLIVNNAAKAIDFYKKVFAAQEMMRMLGPDGKKIMHAELQISGCMVYLADMCQDSTHQPPDKLGTTTVGLTMYCLDIDKVFDRAVKHGCKVTKAVSDMFWGDRMGTLCDPFGHQWTLMQRVEELSPAEVAKRAQKAMAMA